MNLNIGKANEMKSIDEMIEYIEKMISKKDFEREIEYMILNNEQGYDLKSCE